MEAIVLGLLTTVLGLWLGSIEVRMRGIDGRLREAPSREEVDKTIDNKTESIKVLQQEIKEDIKEMRRSLEKLAEK